MIFMAINMIVTVIALSLIIGASFLETNSSKMIAIGTAVGILIVQKIVEIIVVKETRKVSVAVLIAIVVAVIYYVTQLM